MAVWVHDSAEREQGVGVGGAPPQFSGRLLTPLLVLGMLGAGLLGMGYGYDLGVTGGVQGMKSFRIYFFPDFEGGESSMWCHFSDPYLQLVSSAAYIASVPFTFLAFWLCGWRGRVLVMWLGAAAYLIAAGLQAGSQNLPMLYCARAIVGCGMAFGNQAAPVWMSEVALPKHRGAIVAFFQFFVVVGILTANLVNFGTGKMAADGWRISLGVIGGPMLLAACTYPFLPDSPDSLIARQRPGDARRVLQRLRGTPHVEAEWEVMLEETAAGPEARRRACLAHFSSRHRFQRSQFGATLRWVWRYRVHCLLCFILGAFRALTGNPLLLFYAPELFQSLGTSQNYSLLSAVVQASFKLLGNVLCMILVDRVGRKKLQVFGGAGQFCCQVAATLITALSFNGVAMTDAEAWSLTSVLCLFEVFFELSICTLSWVIATEICPLEIRSIGAGFHVMGDLCLQIFFSQLTLTLMCKMQWGVFCMAAGFCLLFILFSLFLIPETRGVPLDRVQELLRTHWLWKRAMRELQEAADKAALEAEALEGRKGLGGGGGGLESSKGERRSSDVLELTALPSGELAASSSSAAVGERGPQAA